MKEFLEIIYYVVQSIWPIFFLALVYLIWKDVNRIAAHVAPEYYYDEEDSDDDDEDETDNAVSTQTKAEPVKEIQVKTEKNTSGKSPSNDEFVVEDLEL